MIDVETGGVASRDAELPSAFTQADQNWEVPNDPRFQRRRTIVTVCIVFACLFGLIGTGLFAVTTIHSVQASYSCNPGDWVNAAGKDLIALTPAGSIDPQTTVPDCGGGPNPVRKFTHEGTPVAVVKQALMRSEANEWSKLEGQPWFGCRTKLIDGHQSYLRTRFYRAQSGEYSYSVSAMYESSLCDMWRPANNPNNAP